MRVQSASSAWTSCNNCSARRASVSAASMVHGAPCSGCSRSGTASANRPVAAKPCTPAIARCRAALRSSSNAPLSSTRCSLRARCSPISRNDSFSVFSFFSPSITACRIAASRCINSSTLTPTDARNTCRRAAISSATFWRSARCSVCARTSARASASRLR